MSDDEPLCCPVCHDDAIHPTTPLSPDRDAYECERCGHTWEA